jgi:hypothetical protein
VDGVHHYVTMAGAAPVAHGGIGAQRKAQTGAGCKTGFKGLGFVHIEQSMLVRRNPSRQNQKAAFAILAPQKVALSTCIVGKQGPQQAMMGGRAIFTFRRIQQLNERTSAG